MKDSVGLVFVSRSGSESLDKKADAYDDGTPHFLALSKNEKDMIAYAKKTCDSVILIVNSSNPMELMPVMQGELEVDAIIWAGHPGDQGFRSVADILAGEVNPSGRLVDIFATDFTKTPSYNNWGKFRYTNADKSPFVEYREGMYNGYRYYETAHDIGAEGFVYGELDNMGVKPIEAVGQEFDPNFHNAVMHVEDENLGENIVAEEFQKGYTYHDTVVRHSMVKVAN